MCCFILLAACSYRRDFALLHMISALLLIEMVFNLQNSGIVLPSMGKRPQSVNCNVIAIPQTVLAPNSQAEFDAPPLFHMQVTPPRQILKRRLMTRWRSLLLTSTR